jgi:Tfp pilus assembly protein FimV
VEQQSSEIPVTQGEARAVDALLKTLWEKARRAAETIAQLREDNRELQSRVEELTRQLYQVQHDLARKDQIISQQNADLAGASAKRPALFDNGERELLATKVKDLLAKIEAYL